MRDARPLRIAFIGHSTKMARSGDRPQSRPSRAASATAAVRVVRPSLRRMFATWRCTVCGLKTNCWAISWSLKPLATNANTSRSRPESNAGGGSPPEPAGASGASSRTQRTRHRRPITGPRKVGVPVERDQRRGRDPRRELTAELVGNRAIASAVYDQRGRTYLIQLRPNVVAISQLQQHRRGLGARRVALVARNSLLFGAVGVAQEDVGQQPRPQTPMGTHGCDDRLAHLRRSDRGSVGIRAVEQ